ncbi:MAG: hypothetical protein WCA13_02775 [Terriglobales bacterium]
MFLRDPRLFGRMLAMHVGNSTLYRNRRSRHGYFVDVIAVADDPLQDIETLQNVSFGMKGGVDLL